MSLKGTILDSINSHQLMTLLVGPYRCASLNCQMTLDTVEKWESHHEDHHPEFKLPCIDPKCTDQFKPKAWNRHIRAKHRNLSDDRLKPYLARSLSTLQSDTEKASTTEGLEAVKKALHSINFELYEPLNLLICLQCRKGIRGVHLFGHLKDAHKDLSSAKKANEILQAMKDKALSMPCDDISSELCFAGGPEIPNIDVENRNDSRTCCGSVFASERTWQKHHNESKCDGKTEKCKIQIIFKSNLQKRPQAVWRVRSLNIAQHNTQTQSLTENLLDQLANLQRARAENVIPTGIQRDKTLSPWLRRTGWAEMFQGVSLKDPYSKLPRKHEKTTCVAYQTLRKAADKMLTERTSLFINNTNQHQNRILAMISNKDEILLPRPIGFVINDTIATYSSHITPMLYLIYLYMKADDPKAFIFTVPDDVYALGTRMVALVDEEEGDKDALSDLICDIIESISIKPVLSAQNKHIIFGCLAYQGIRKSEGIYEFSRPFKMSPIIAAYVYAIRLVLYSQQIRRYLAEAGITSFTELGDSETGYFSSLQEVQKQHLWITTQSPFAMMVDLLTYSKAASDGPDEGIVSWNSMGSELRFGRMRILMMGKF
jgi:hypothetical protein